MATLSALPALLTGKQPDVLGNFERITALKSVLGQQQEQQQDITLKNMQIKNMQTLQNLSPQFLKKDSDGNVTGYDFDGLFKAASAQGVPPQMLQPIIEAQKSSIALNDAQLAHEQKVNGILTDHLESVRDLIDKGADSQSIVSATRSAVQEGQQYGHFKGLDANSINQPPTKQQLDTFEAELGMHQQLLADSKTQAEGFKAQQQGNLAQTQSQLNQIKLKLANAKPGDFDSQIDSVIPAGQFGDLNSATKAMVNQSLNRGDVDSAKQAIDRAFGTVSDIAKETNPAIAQARAQQAAMLAKIVEPLRMQIMTTFQNDKDARDKIEGSVLKPYQDKMSQIAELNATLDQASNGNVASARAALLKMMGVSNPDGTKRYNAQEAARMASMGSIPQRIQGTVQNALTGNEWTPQMIADMRSFAQGQAGAAQQSLNGGIDNVNALYGTKVGAGLKQNANGGLPQGGGKVIDKATAMQFYRAAGNDPNKARQLAAQNGWKVQ